MLRKLFVFLLPVALLTAAGCGGGEDPVDDPCDGVTCGANASCDEATGECACDPGYTGDATAGCTEPERCTETTCGHGTCNDESGAPVCTCETGWAGDRCDACATDYALEDGACINEKQVPCKDAAPENATSTVADVTVTYTTANGWSEPAECDWSCDEGYEGETCADCAEGYVEIDGACVQTNCTENSCNGHGTCTSDGEGIVCTCDAGYEGPTCGECAEDYVRVDDACIPEACTEDACNYNGECSTIAGGVSCDCYEGYTGTYCADCDEGFVKVGLFCVAEMCTEDSCSGHGTCETVAANTYECTCEEGYKGASCSECDAGYAKVGDSCIIDACPANACSGNGTCITTGEGTFTCSCNEGYQGDSCSECQDGFVSIGQLCVADLCDAQACNGRGSCEMVAANEYECTCQEGYAGATCADCANGFAPVGSECIADACTESSCSGHGTCTTTGPDEVECSCFPGYTGETCADCAEGYVLEDGACVSSTDIKWCNVEFPKTHSAPLDNAAEIIYGRVQSTATETTVGAMAAGILGKACFGVGPITDQVDLSTLECFEAEFHKEKGDADEYMALVEFDAVGSFDYVYAFSADDGATWSICDADDGAPFVPGKATIEETFAAVGATPIDATTVEVKFNRAVKADTAAAEKFSILDADANFLDVTGADVAGDTVTLTTAAQVGETEYTVVVDKSVADERFERTMIEDAYLEFTGFGPPPFKAISATATAADKVVVKFSEVVQADSFAADGSEFTIMDLNTDLLDVTAAVADGDTIILTTAPQTEGMDYVLELPTTIKDSLGRELGTAALLDFTGYAVPVGASVFFSEYIEGSGNNKAIEVYNGTGAEVTCTIMLYTNGSKTAGSSLEVTVPALGVYSVCNNNAVADLKDRCDETQGGGVINFNGDDALTLECGGEVVDVFGEVGVDPGSAWSANGVTTVDKTLRRKCSVTSGATTVGEDGFDPSIEWDMFDVNTFDGIGSHSTGCP